MQTEPLKHTEVKVRGINLKLMTYTRSLELCARMNYETENLDFIDRIQAGEVMYDLGACEGRFSIYAALKGIRVISFEPEAKNYSVFVQNVALNELSPSQLKPIHAGLGEKDGKATLNIGQPWEGGHQKVVDHNEVRNDLNFNFVDKQVVDIVSLDSILENGNEPIPNYLKIDIDGSEMPFLRGAVKTLNRPELKGIIFELNEVDPNYETILETLSNAGFTIQERFQVPNEPTLYNIIFAKSL
jgi:FkbM family methyltransferase